MGRLKKVLKKQSGATLLEYIVKVALVALICVAAITNIGVEAASVYCKVHKSLEATAAVSVDWKFNPETQECEIPCQGWCG